MIEIVIDAIRICDERSQIFVEEGGAKASNPFFLQKGLLIKREKGKFY